MYNTTDHHSISGRESIERQILQERLQLIFQASGINTLALLLAAGGFVFVMQARYPLSTLMTWFGVLSLTTLPRLLLARSYLGLNPAPPNPNRWLSAFRAGIFSTALVFGSISLLFWDGRIDSYQAFTLAFLLSVSSGALITVQDFFAGATFITLLVLPMAIRSLLGDDPILITGGILEIIMLLMFGSFGYKYQNTLASASRLRHQNNELLSKLKQEKQQLNSRLGRILNDSSNEIYVIDANSLRFLQVNARAINNLGYSADVILKMTLPEVFEAFNELDVCRLLTPMIREEKEFVFYRGHHICHSGKTYPVEVSFHYSQQENPPIIVATALDTTERTVYEGKLRKQANEDPLTGLPNRHYMTRHLAHALQRAQRTNTTLALLFLDLDNFKSINDSLGHSAGDELLRNAATRIQSVLRKTDIAARLGGDEFLVLLENIDSPKEAGDIAERLVAEFVRLFDVAGRRVHSTTSVGISIYPGDGDNTEMLMQSADTAMYHAKQLGRSGYQFFSEDMRIAAEEQMLIASHLNRALSNDEITLVYQPIIELQRGMERIVGAEALVRWANDDLGHVAPDRFIPIAESLGLIQDIGQFVLNEACREASLWSDIDGKQTYVSVNVSSRQFRNGDLLDCVDAALDQSGLSSDALRLEITESLLIQDSQHPLHILNALKERGIQLALDDFGTGYSSLSYLKKFPLQLLKIDRAFINDIGRDTNDEILVSAIIAMAKSLGLGIIAEGVETVSQLDFLRQRDVEMIQGYYFSPPISGEEFRALLEKQQRQTLKVVGGRNG